MLFAAVVFLSAALLFQVQLIVSKQLLPWFGGTPAVWTTSQMFFQIVLLAGYAYAHLLTTRVPPAQQFRVHGGFLVAAIGALAALTIWGGDPLLVPASMKPDGSGVPIIELLMVLAASVGLPFFVLSTTGPLLQRWHSHGSVSLDATYRLYALSNLGSFIGLLAYPLGVERLLDLTQQAWLWTALFVIYAAGCATLARGAAQAAAIAPPPNLPPVQDHAADGDGTSLARMAVWLLLSATGSVAFLAATNQLTQDVAAVPFLWALPLAIYLLTLVICFDRPQWYSRRWMPIAAAVASVAMAPTVLSGLRMPWQIVVHGAFLFCFCMLCHGELVRLRPSARQLTLFYLLVAVGGAAGGIFVGLIAPFAFPDFWEFPLIVLVGWLVVGVVWRIDRRSPWHTGDRVVFAALVAIVAVLVIRYPIERTRLGRLSWLVEYGWAATLAGGATLAAAACVVLWRSRLARSTFWPQALVGLLVLVSAFFLVGRIEGSRDGVVHASRNFYGVVRVTSTPIGPMEALQLRHGTTMHGAQVELLGDRSTPTAYYSPTTGVSIASTTGIRSNPDGHGDRTGGVHFGVVGMGVGTMTAFARAGDRVRLYEINPEIIDLASGPRALFTFVKDSRAAVTVVAGDARISLERELSAIGSQQFDLLAMDAFSSDAVPMHLVTAEAFRVYAAHLAGEHAILAVNVTNRHIDLEPVVVAGARALGFQGVRVDSRGDPPLVAASSWILLARLPAVVDRIARAAGPRARPLRERAVAFTDRSSNLFAVLK